MPLQPYPVAFLLLLFSSHLSAYVIDFYRAFTMYETVLGARAIIMNRGFVIRLHLYPTFLLSISKVHDFWVCFVTRLD